MLPQQVPVVANAVLAGILAALPPVNLTDPVGPSHVGRSAHLLTAVTDNAYLATDVEIGEHHMFHQLVIKLALGGKSNSINPIVHAFLLRIVVVRIRRRRRAQQCCFDVESPLAFALASQASVRLCA